VGDAPDLAPKILVMPYPVRSVIDEAWVRERGRRVEPPVRVLFMGGDFLRKGGPDLLSAWADAGFAGRATLDLVTDWPVDVPNLPTGVRLHRGITPYTPQWTTLWRQADLFVMPTRHEAFGMVFQEAAASGLPVVATRINAIPEIVADGSTGILVAPGDRAGLAAAMRALIDGPDLRLRMGAAALERIRTVGAPARYAARLETVILSVATR
jgi:glycosyltransferase involved in cell wall biosynthesis